MLGSMLPSVVQSTAHEERQREFSGPTSHHLRLLVQAGWDSQGQALQVSVNNTETDSLSGCPWTPTWPREDSRGSHSGDTQLALLGSCPESPRKVSGATGRFLSSVHLTERDPHVVSTDLSASSAEATHCDTHSSGPSERQKPEEYSRTHTNQTQVNQSEN